MKRKVEFKQENLSEIEHKEFKALVESVVKNGKAELIREDWDMGHVDEDYLGFGVWDSYYNELFDWEVFDNLDEVKKIISEYDEEGFLKPCVVYYTKQGWRVRGGKAEPDGVIEYEDEIRIHNIIIID